MNLRPLCTANVKPTISGVTVERRDQVFTTRFSPDSSIARTRFTRWRSTKGPFFTERATRATPCPSLFRLAPLENELLRALVVAGLVALGGLAPRGLRMVALRAPLAAAVRMIDRVHRNPADVRPPTEPADATGLAVRQVLVLEVADLTHGRAAAEADPPQ